MNSNSYFLTLIISYKFCYFFSINKSLFEIKINDMVSPVFCSDFLFVFNLNCFATKLLPKLISKKVLVIVYENFISLKKLFGMEIDIVGVIFC